jgi:hypothetical protein
LEVSSGIAGGQFVEGSAQDRVQEMTATSMSSHKEDGEQKVPQIEMPEWGKKLENFK